MREMDSRALKVKTYPVDLLWGCVATLRASSSERVGCGRVEIFSDRAGIAARACRSGHADAVPLAVRRRIAGDSKRRGVDFAGGDA